MPMTSKTPEKELPGRSVREIEEMIEPIEQYLLQTREVLDRIEGHIKDLKKEHGIGEVTKEMHSLRKDPWSHSAKGL